MKTCSLCRKEINEKERYTHVEDWENKKMTKEVWCHLTCFIKSMNREINELELKAKRMLNQAEGIFNRIAPANEEYII